MTETRYPLQWPEGWPVTPPDQRTDGSQFREKNNRGTWGYKPVGFSTALTKLSRELENIADHGTESVISTNFRLNSYGDPSPTRGKARDQSAAVYFTRKARRMAVASDRYLTIEANLSSIRLALEAMRQLERHGGEAMADRAYTGFEALPPPLRWRDILGNCRDMAEVKQAYRKKAAAAHPDAGGSAQGWHDLQAAYEAAIRELGGFQ
jgi:hypothetical protein